MRTTPLHPVGIQSSGGLAGGLVRHRLLRILYVIYARDRVVVMTACRQYLCGKGDAEE